MSEDQITLLEIWSTAFLGNIPSQRLLDERGLKPQSLPRLVADAASEIRRLRRKLEHAGLSLEDA